MTVTFYASFSKRRNSTKQPSGSSQGFGSVRLKEGTSMMKPVFLLSQVNWHWNYASWDSRYYYVIDIVSQGNEYFEIHCELDVLATFKTQIGNYSTLISRAASDQNYDVVDSIYPAKTRPTTKRTQIASDGIFTTNQSEGTFLLGAMGTLGLDFYAFNAFQFNNFCYQAFPSLGVSMSQWVARSLAEAPAGGINAVLSSIVLLKWLPIKYSLISSQLTSVTTVQLGCLEVTAPAGKISGDIAYRILSKTISFPDRDDAGARGRWLYLPPYANYSVYIPPFGQIAIDGSYLISSGLELSADIMVEMMTGNVTLRLYYGIGYSGPKMVGVYNTNVGVDLKSGGVGANAGGVLAGIAGAVASYYEKDYAGVAASIGSAVKSAIPQPYQTGGGVSGPVADLGQNWYAYATYFDPIDENQAELGRPLAEVKTISTLSGFVQCADAKLAIPGHAEEMVEVNTLLNSGIFYE